MKTYLFLVTWLVFACNKPDGNEIDKEVPSAEIIYVKDLAGPNGDDIFISNADGSNERRLTTIGSGLPGGTGKSIDWPVSGVNKFYFLGNHEIDPFQIYSMNPDGTGISRITNNPGASHVSLRVSRASGRMAYVKSQVLTTSLPDGSDERSLIPWATYPEWHPDGERIIFCGYEQVVNGLLQNNLGIVRFDGTNATQITNSTGRYYYSVCVFPDGRKICYTTNGKIYIANIDGSNEVPVAPETNKFAYGLTKDGKWVFYLDITNGGYSFIKTDGSKRVAVGFSGFIYNPSIR